MTPDYKLALSFLTNVSAKLIRIMTESGVTPEDMFRLSDNELALSLGLNEKSIANLKRHEALCRAQQEEKFINSHGIRYYFLNDDNYPILLKEIESPPVVLYQYGDCNLESRHILSIVGTRKCTSYGYNFAKQLVGYLAERYDDLIIVSGLAYGIDAAAHEGSLDSGCCTIGVLAHGLDMIYPAQHRSLAQRILKAGGALLTEYPSGEKPFRQRFLERNRIVATIANGVVVAESEVKGGAMSTANIAFSYSRDVLALPGKLSDKISSGCNLLIRQHKADIITQFSDVEESLMWQSTSRDNESSQHTLFPELDGDSGRIYNVIKELEIATIDTIANQCNLPVSIVIQLLTEMELDDIIVRKPGNRFSLS